MKIDSLIIDEVDEFPDVIKEVSPKWKRRVDGNLRDFIVGIDFVANGEIPENCIVILDTKSNKIVYGFTS